MSNSTNTTLNTNLSMWDEPQSLAEIKSIFAPLLTDNEFKAFVGMGKATGLNPFLKEIWAVKYDPKAPASYFIGRDGYRVSAQRHPDYDYHRVEAVYSEDLFENINGEINHRYKFGGRGALLGAYCIVKRKSSDRVISVSVSLAEYDKNHSNWRTMKETMIKKTAEAQGLRAAFQEIFAGTNDETEQAAIGQPKTQTENLKNKIIEATKPDQPVSIETGELMIDDALIDKIEIVMEEKQFTDDRRSKMLAYYKVGELRELTLSQAQHVLEQLTK